MKMGCLSLLPFFLPRPSSHYASTHTHTHTHARRASQVQMSFILTDISYTAEVFQQFSRADFVESYNANPPMTQQLSGNPGYQVGFPVLVRGRRGERAGQKGKRKS